MAQTGMVADGRLSDWIPLCVLASAVPRDAVEVAGRDASPAGGNTSPPLSATIVCSGDLATSRSIFGGTTEIMKEIIGGGLGL